MVFFLFYYYFIILFVYVNLGFGQFELLIDFLIEFMDEEFD